MAQALALGLGVNSGFGFSGADELAGELAGELEILHSAVGSAAVLTVTVSNPAL